MTKSKAEHTSTNEGFSLIPNRKLLELYTAMQRCRRISEGGGNGRAKTGTWSILGREASAVGAAMDLLPQDTVGPSLWAEAVVEAINPSVGIASSCLLAARHALDGGDGRQLTVLFSNGIGRSQLSWNRALSFAVAHNLPVLFVSLGCQATLERANFAQSNPLKRKSYALPTIGVDGNDVVAVYRVASESMAHARRGHGPTLIDCRAATFGDPIENMRKYLMGKGLNPG